MQSVISFTPRESDKAGKCRKAQLYREIVALDSESGRALVTVRIYWPESFAYAVAWISGGGVYAHGGGRAGGGGYCKASAAAAYALADAGIKLEHDIGGRGLSAVREAVEVVARHLGAARVIVHESHP
jgi:hypothetical protein